VEVIDCISDCADPGQAEYSLTVQRDSANAAVELVTDNEPE
jgi:hypothetical protein